MKLRDLLISLFVFVCWAFKELHLATQSVIFISVLLKWKKTPEDQIQHPLGKSDGPIYYFICTN